MSRNEIELDERVRSDPDRLTELLLPVLDNTDKEFAMYTNTDALAKATQALKEGKLPKDRADEIASQYRQLIYRGLILAMQVGYLEALKDYGVKTDAD